MGNEDLVNLPNWLVLKLRIEGEDAIGLADVELLDYRHGLDLRAGVMTRSVRFRDAAGRETTVRCRRFVSMASPHGAGIEWTLIANNWSGRIQVVSAIDGRVTNRGVARYLELEGRHLDPVSPRTFGPDVIALKVQTRQSNVYISQAARTRVFDGRGPLAVERTLYQTDDYIQQVLALGFQPVSINVPSRLAESDDPDLDRVEGKVVAPARVGEGRQLCADIVSAASYIAIPAFATTMSSRRSFATA